MDAKKVNSKFREWFKRYFIAECLGTILSLCFAYIAYSQSHSYLIAAGAGFIGEGIGFYGYFIVSELLFNRRKYRNLPSLKRLSKVISRSGTDLVIEFGPAEVIDNILIRPFLMFYVPQHIEPYALGFIVGKFAADIIFYIFAICGYEFKKRIYSKPKA